MSVDSKVPEIRFEGFGGEWGQDNISNIAPLQRGFDLPKNSIKVGAHPVVMSNGVNCFHNEFRAKAPGVVTGRSGTIGNIHYIDVDYWPHNTSLWVTNFHKNVPLFIYYLYVKLDLKRFGTGSGVPTLNRNDVHVQSVALPKDSKEQAAIGNYFQKLDALINQHQQKHNKLSYIKKSMLEKMFPKQGETIPDIRFKGFSGEWDEISLLDSIERIIDFRGRTPKKLGLDWSPSGYRALSALNVKQGYIDFSIDPHFGDQELYDKWMNGSELHQGQVLFTTEAPMGNVAQVPNTDKYILSQRTIAFVVKSEIISEDFLAVLLRSYNVFRELSALSSGGTAKGVSQKVLANLSVSIPTDLVEQTAIGNYFQKLDALINQHQQQITKLNNIKQACLSKMFV